MVAKKNFLVQKSSVFLVQLILSVVGSRIFADQHTSNESEDFFDMSLEELMEIEVVTPSRKPQSIDKAPSNITVITEKDIKDSGAQTLGELLERLPGVYIPTQGHGEESIYIRGIGERYNDKTLLLFDGYPLRDLYYSRHHLNATIPLANIKRIEIVRGPGSSLYGTNAFAGVVNIITKKADDVDGTELMTGIGSRGSEHGHVLWGRQGKKGGVLILARYLDADIDTVDRDEAGDLSGQKRFLKNSAFHLVGTHKDIDFQAGYYRTKLPDFMEAITTTDISTQETAFFRLGHTKDLTDRLNIRTRAYSNMFWINKESSELDSGYIVKRKESSRESSIFGLDVQCRYKLSKNNDLLFGATYEHERLVHSWSRKWKANNPGDPLDFQGFSGWVAQNQESVPTEVTNSNIAVYVEDEIRLIPDVLNLTVGARLDDYEATESHLSPRFGIVWEPRKGTIVKGLFGEAFRSPSYRELYKQTDDNNNEGNTSLKPEVVKSTELNVIQYLGKNHRFDFSLFRSRVEDFIKTVGNGNYENLRVRHYTGIELAMKGRFPVAKTQYFINYTNLDGDESDGSDISRIPEEIFNVGLTYEGLRYVTISPSLQYVGKRNRPSNYQQDLIDDGKNVIDNLGSYSVFNIAVRTTKAMHPGLELAFVVQNVFDEKYFTVSEKSEKYDVQRPGRTLWLTLTCRF